ncbi:MAG: hypothetical protein J6T26_02375 [Firmicutes bacterium]|nr:hypothetical protein [Bacillota bacterium]
MEKAEDSLRQRAGIGTLAEKTLHAAVKFYLEPDPAYHEVPHLGFVADILNSEGVIEIQTRSFERLRRKLAVFLAAGPVTLVCPLPHVKYLLWLDPETGEVSRRRKSPKTGRPWHLLPELNRIGELLDHPDLSILVLLLDMEEYRNLDGWSRDRKRGSHRLERLPLSLHRELWLREKADWRAMLPEGLPEEFTRQEFAKLGRFSERQSGAALKVLCRMGLAERCGKQGRAYLYRLTPPE